MDAKSRPGATARAPLVSREECISSYGIDCGDGLLWEGGSWAPGGEYVKQLRISNAATRTQHIRYRLPETKFFFMEFPEEIVLSPGMHILLSVRFRPIRLDEYDDCVQFTCDDGSFSVPVRARLARLAVQVEPALALGLVPVNEVTTGTVAFRNTGQVDAEYSWTVVAPFSVHPPSGVLLAGSSIQVTVSVQPDVASVLRSVATLHVRGSEEAQCVEVTATSKFQQIALDTTSVAFGEVQLATLADACTRVVTVRNVGPVRATVSVHAADEGSGRFVAVRPASQLVPAGGTAEFTTRFQAHTAGVRAVEYFAFSCPGGNSVRCEVSATAGGPMLTLAKKDKPGAAPSKRPNAVQFGDIRVGDTVSQVVTLRNHSKSAASYEFTAEQEGVFRFSDVRGIVPPQLPKEIVIAFAPRAAGNYYRRILCMVADGEPMYVDLVATAYDDSRRPFPMRWKHVEAHRKRGDDVRLLAPDAVLQRVRDGNADDIASMQREAEWALTSAFTRSGDRTRAGQAAYMTAFEPRDAAHAPVVLMESSLNFGASSRVKLPERKVVHMHNRSETKMLVTWVVPPSPHAPAARDSALLSQTAAATAAGGKGTTTAAAFAAGAPPPDMFEWIVTPETAEIEPGAVAEFKVSFRPSKDSTCVSQELEAYVSPKVNRSFRLVDEDAFIPPVCLPLHVIGHTFRPTETFMPQMLTSFGGSALEQVLVLPPACVGEAVFYTFQLRNASEVPAIFEFHSPHGSGHVLSVQPSMGCVGVNSFVLVSVRFTPRAARTYRVPLELLINDSHENAMRVVCEATGTLPHLHMPDDASVFIKPTALGIASKRSFIVKNASQVPLKMRWSVDKHVSEDVYVSPQEADVPANADASVTIAYAPRAEGVLDTHLRCDVHYAGVSDVDALSLLAGEGRASAGDVTVVGQPRVAGVDEETQELITVSDSGEPLQSLRLRVQSRAVASGLSFSISSLDLGAVRVGCTIKAPITLRNTSVAAIRFNADAVVQLVGAALANARVSDAVDMDLEAARAEARAARAARHGHSVYDHGHVHTVACSVGSLEGDGAPVVSFHPSEGMLSPNGEMNIIMSVTMHRPVQHRVRVYVVCGDAASMGGMVVNPSKLAALSAAADAELDPRQPELIDWAREPRNASHLWCDVLAAAVHPHVCVEDVTSLTSREALTLLFPYHIAGLHNRFSPPAANDITVTVPGGVAAASVMAVLDASTVHAPKGAERTSSSNLVQPRDLWMRAGKDGFSQAAQACGFAKPAELGWGGWTISQPRVEASVAVSTHSLWQQLSLRSLNAALAREHGPPGHVRMTFTPAPLGSPPQLLLLCVRNPTAVTASIAFTFPSEADIELEPWVELPPVTGDDAITQELVQRCIFDIQPRRARLAAGEATCFRVHYAYASLLSSGVHELPVTMTTEGGATVQLRLVGRTLPATTPYLHVCTPSDDSVYLESVCVGATQPPEQRIAIRNVTALPVRYRVHPASLRDFTAMHHGFDVFRVLDEDGVVPPGGTLSLRVVFTPLEPIEYELPLSMQYATARGGERSPPDSPGYGSAPRVGRAVSFGASNQLDADGDWDTPSDEAPVQLHIRMRAHGFSAASSHNGDMLALPPLNERVDARFTLIPPTTAARAAQGNKPAFEPACIVMEYAAPGADAVEARPPTRTRGLVNSETQERIRPCVQPLLKCASYEASSCGETLAESVYAVSGLDTLSSGVSTSANPTDVILALRRVGDSNAVADALDHMLAGGPSDGPQSLDTSLARVFTGPDALAAAAAVTELLRAQDVLASRETSSKPAGALVQPHAHKHARKSFIVPVRSSALEEHMYTLLSRVHEMSSSGGVGSVQSLFRPGCEPAPHFGAHAPASAWVLPLHNDLPEGMCSMHPRSLRFGDSPTGGISYRTLVLRNERSIAGDDADLEFAFDDAHPLIQAGCVQLHPSSGRIPAGSAVLIRVTLNAPYTPMCIADDIACTIRVPVLQVRARATAIVRELLAGRKRARAQPPRRSHVSVAEKTTRSRAMQMMGAARDGAISVATAGSRARGPSYTPSGASSSLMSAAMTRAGASSRPAVLAAAGQMIALGNASLPQAARERGYGSSALSPRTPQDGSIMMAVPSVLAPAARVPSPDSVDAPWSAKSRTSLRGAAGEDARTVLSALLCGDTAVDMNVSSLGRGAEDGEVDSDALPLPPPPSCVLHLHVAATCMNAQDFMRIFSREHMAAFAMPRTVVSVAASTGEGDDASAGSVAAARSVLQELLADVVAEVVNMDGADAAPSAGDGDAPIQRANALTFDAVRAARGDVATATRIVTADAHVRGSQIMGDALARASGSTGRSLRDAALPPPRPGDADVHTDTAVASALTDAGCREAVCRIVEGTLLQLMREGVAGEWDPVAAPDEHLQSLHEHRARVLQDGSIVRSADELLRDSEGEDDAAGDSEGHMPAYQAAPDDD